MPAEPDKKSPPRRPQPNPLADASTLWLLLVVGLLAIFALYWWQGRNDRSEISYGFFRHQLEDDKNVVSVNIEGAKLFGEFKEAPIDPDAEKDSSGAYPKLKKKFVTIVPPMALADPSLDRVLRERLKGEYKASEPADNTVWLLMFYMLVPVGLLVGLWFLFGKFRDSFFAGGLTGGFSKSGAAALRGGRASR